MDALKKSMRRAESRSLGILWLSVQANRQSGKRHRKPHAPTSLTAQVALVASANQFPAHFAAQEVSVLLAFGFNHDAASAVEDVKLQKPSSTLSGSFSCRCATESSKGYAPTKRIS